MSKHLSKFLKNATRVAVVGVGSEVRGDDAAGIEVLNGLRSKLRSANVLLVDGGTTPENATSQIKNFKPTHVIFVDATDFGAEPGEVVVAEPAAIRGHSVSTHTVPLSALAGYLKVETGASVILIGIQPASVSMGARISAAVKFSVERVAEILSCELNSVKCR